MRYWVCAWTIAAATNFVVGLVTGAASALLERVSLLEVVRAAVRRAVFSCGFCFGVSCLTLALWSRYVRGVPGRLRLTGGHFWLASGRDILHWRLAERGWLPWACEVRVSGRTYSSDGATRNS